MPEAVFVLSPGVDPWLRELSDAVREELARQGVPSSAHGSFPEPRPGRVYVLVSPRRFLADEGETALPDPVILERTVVLDAQDPQSLGPDSHLELLRTAGAVFDVGQRAVTELHRLGIAARLLRPGYVAGWDRFDSGAQRPIDVIFQAERSARRTSHLAAAADILARHMCVVELRDDPSDPGVTSGEARRVLLAQAKIALGLHRTDEAQLDWLSAVEAMHCGAVVVSEHATGVPPFVAGEHLLVASAAALPHVVEAALRDEGRLSRLRAQAHERLRDWLPLSASVGVLRAALVELVGRPVPAGVFLGVGRDGVSAPAAEVSSTEPDVRAELTIARQELIEVRRELAQLNAAVETVHERDEGDGVVHRNGAWSSRRQPRISVLLHVGEADGSAIATLESVSRSRERDLEVIVVGGSGGEAQETVRWLRAHPRLPSTFMRKAGVAGRGRARNAALDLARGVLTCVIEPGTILYPRCLGELASALEGETNATFVYPIVAIKGATAAFLHAGGDWLLNTGAWCPGRLRNGNPVVTPALIRTAALRQVGGYVEQGPLRGMEDYDLWCRLAERGWSGRQVPQILAYRRAADARGELEALRAPAGVVREILAERAPSVISADLALA